MQNILEILGTFAFGVSGIRLASAKGFDIFGALFTGLICACGGGILRDFILNTVPVCFIEPLYITVCLASLVFVFLLKKYLVTLDNTIFFFDALGLGLFNIIGLEKALGCGFSVWASIIIGCLTGVFGGILRDITIREEPLIFKKELYACSCLVGSLVYIGLFDSGFSHELCSVYGIVSCIIFRIVSSIFKINLPRLYVE